MNDQECPVKGCDRRIPLHKLMCRGHWFLVPTPIQRAVYRAWTARQQARGKPAAAAAVQEHQAVKEQAIAAVEERLASR